MTKKDYELFAQSVLEVTQEGGFYNRNGNSTIDLVRFLVDVFQKDNYNFNPDKFKEACYTGKHIRKAIKERC